MAYRYCAGLRHLSHSALENNYSMESKPPRKNKSRKPTRKQLVQQLARQERRLRKATKRANTQGELALLRVTPDFKFFGEIIIRSREDAINAAITYSNVIPHRLVLFSDGSAFSRVIDRRSASLVPRGFGAAVAYKMYGDDDKWHERLYHLRGGPSIFRAELTAVAEALAIALPWAIQRKTLDESHLEEGLEPCEVIIFTDSQDVLRSVEKLRDEALTEHRMPKGDPVIRKVITRSQYLRQLAVRVELHWVPGHAHVEGNERADAAARLAAVESDDGITRDEGLVLIEAELTRQQGQSFKPILTIETRGHQGTRRRIIAGKELQG